MSAAIEHARNPYSDHEGFHDAATIWITPEDIARVAEAQNSLAADLGTESVMPQEGSESMLEIKERDQALAMRFNAVRNAHAQFFNSEVHAGENLDVSSMVDGETLSKILNDYIREGNDLIARELELWEKFRIENGFTNEGQKEILDDAFNRRHAPFEEYFSEGETIRFASVYSSKRELPVADTVFGPASASDVDSLTSLHAIIQAHMQQGPNAELAAFWSQTPEAAEAIQQSDPENTSEPVPPTVMAEHIEKNPTGHLEISQDPDKIEPSQVDKSVAGTLDVPKFSAEKTIETPRSPTRAGATQPDLKPATPRTNRSGIFTTPPILKRMGKALWRTITFQKAVTGTEAEEKAPILGGNILTDGLSSELATRRPRVVAEAPALQYDCLAQILNKNSSNLLQRLRQEEGQEPQDWVMNGTHPNAVHMLPVILGSLSSDQRFPARFIARDTPKSFETSELEITAPLDIKEFFRQEEQAKANKRAGILRALEALSNKTPTELGIKELVLLDGRLIDPNDATTLLLGSSAHLHGGHNHDNGPQTLRNMAPTASSST